jgi:hypothetical protein
MRTVNWKTVSDIDLLQLSGGGGPGSGSSFAYDLGYAAARTIRMFIGFCRKAAEYQHSLPVGHKK